MLYMVTSVGHAIPTGRWKTEHFVAGDPALELANTILYRFAETREDAIAKVQDLADWAASIGLAETTAKVTSKDLPKVHLVRENIYAMFSAVAAGRSFPDSSFALLLRNAAERFEVSAIPKLHAEIAWRAIVASIALPREKIGECPRCGWLFLDKSKGGRRRWCSMAVCGTAEKVRAYRKRKGKESSISEGRS